MVDYLYMHTFFVLHLRIDDLKNDFFYAVRDLLTDSLLHSFLNHVNSLFTYNRTWLWRPFWEHTVEERDIWLRLQVIDVNPITTTDGVRIHITVIGPISHFSRIWSWHCWRNFFQLQISKNTHAFRNYTCYNLMTNHTERSFEEYRASILRLRLDQKSKQIRTNV